MFGCFVSSSNSVRLWHSSALCLGLDCICLFPSCPKCKRKLKLITLGASMLANVAESMWSHVTSACSTCYAYFSRHYGQKGRNMVAGVTDSDTFTPDRPATETEHARKEALLRREDRLHERLSDSHKKKRKERAFNFDELQPATQTKRLKRATTEFMGNASQLAEEIAEKHDVPLTALRDQAATQVQKEFSSHVVARSHPQ